MAFLCSSPFSTLERVTVATSTYPHSYIRRTSVIPFQKRRKRWRACMSSAFNRTILDEPAIMEFPCLPFNAAEVFVPTATKTLHLYEARFLALLDEALGKYNSMFAHIVIERVSDGTEEGTLSFATKYGCLARIENVRRMEVGALVTIRGVGRVNLAKLTQWEPFLKGSLVPFHDAASPDTKDIDAAVQGLKVILADVQRLQIKLRTSKDELLQTPLENALQWAEKGRVHESASSFIPSKAESLSFVPLQPVTSASASELQALLQERIWSMEATNTLQRLEKVTKHAEHNRSSLAAKLALQSLQF